MNRQELSQTTSAEVVNQASSGSRLIRIEGKDVDGALVRIPFGTLLMTPDFHAVPVAHRLTRAGFVMALLRQRPEVMNDL